jgi:hypothetical protein
VPGLECYKAAAVSLVHGYLIIVPARPDARLMTVEKHFKCSAEILSAIVDSLTIKLMRKYARVSHQNVPAHVIITVHILITAAVYRFRILGGIYDR